MRVDLLEAIESAIERDPEIGAIIIECSMLGPYSNDMRRKFGMPVHDGMTVFNFLADSLSIMPRLENNKQIDMKIENPDINTAVKEVIKVWKAFSPDKKQELLKDDFMTYVNPGGVIVERNEIDGKRHGPEIWYLFDDMIEINLWTDRGNTLQAMLRFNIDGTELWRDDKNGLMNDWIFI